MAAPSSLDQDGSPGAGDLGEMLRADVSPAVEFGANDHRWNFRQAIERELSQAHAFRDMMKRRVNIGSRVADHVDASYVKLGSGRIVLARLLAGEEVADQRRGKARVGDESGFDDVAQVDQLHRVVPCHKNDTVACGTGHRFVW